MNNLYYDGSRGGFYSQEAANAIFTGAMTRLYGWIALGVITTGAVGWISYQAGVLESIIENFGMIGFFVVLGVWIAGLFGLSFLANRVSPAVAGGAYLVFTALTGLMISTIFWTYTGNTIVLAFALTTAGFSVMSVGVGGGLGAWMGGALHDLTGDYFVSFNVANSLLLVSVLAVWITGLDWMRRFDRRLWPASGKV